VLQEQFGLSPVDRVQPDLWLIAQDNEGRPEIIEAVALLAACCGSSLGMRILADALKKVSQVKDDFAGIALMRGQEWARLASLRDLGRLELDEEVFPALASITQAFYSKGLELPRKLQLLPGEAATLPVLREFAPPPPAAGPQPPVTGTRPTLGSRPTVGPRVRIFDRVPQERLAQHPGLTRLVEPVPLALAPSPIRLREALEREFPWMGPAIDRILQDVLLCHFGGDGSSVLKLTPLLLVGAPGTGKTRFCQRLSELCGLASETMSLAGVADARLLLGTSAGWANSTPSFPLALVGRSGIGNPLIILDELEKAHRGSMMSNAGDVIAGLLNFLEPESAKRFLESSLGCRADLSRVNWLATANELSPLPAALRSRFTVIEVPNPGPEHFDQLVAGILAELKAPPLEEAAAEWLWERFCRGGVSVRALKRAIVGAQQVRQKIPLKLH
jgi:hypothetical protein